MPEIKQRRGRKRIYNTPEEKEAARKRYRKASSEKTRNISVDADLVGQLNEQADRLEDRFGFRPTHSQTLRHLLAEATKRIN